ncbi:DNA alkylation repair protein [Tessaracoccus defluvii]|uniref:DNA alkylation repair protein n=1 Tax=Tessaracoccus defluvii TaxID=1285901 RepID=A0A7H0H4Y8_9ACTN|nr:DNA alkylation repair protein [Tessaracoccus defluvii]QNP55604.1 DNA alkylation repair protein [Tessaracoccus defluvii]
MTDTTVSDLLAELATLEDPKMRAINEKRGDDHGVNLTKLRGIAKRLGRNDDLARRLWATAVTPARLLAILISRPKSWTADEYDAMLREARAPKVIDWLVGYLAGKSPDAEALRVRWLADTDPVVEAAGWSLTANTVVKRPELLDLPALLDVIEADMADAPERKQWEMNSTLAQIGITTEPLRERAIAIGERLGVLRDYPTPPNCTSPFAPSWIAEMVRRNA